MTNKECMVSCVRALENVRVPVGLMEDMGVTLIAVRNTLIAQIKAIEKEEEEKRHADDTVQRQDAEPENH